MIVYVPPAVEALDLAGPLQVFGEARELGGRWETVLASPEPRVRGDQGLELSALVPLPAPGVDDLVLVPGLRFDHLERVPGEVLAWLRRAWEVGAELASVCVGSFVLGAIGLLDGRECTTHWSRIDDLKRLHPKARVIDDRLFVVDGRLTTSAGIASGIDMALAMVERRDGPLLAAAVARELVVYLRRDGTHAQRSVYLDYRSHLHPGVHRVQDWIISHPEARATLPELAAVAGLSPRHLTRLFRDKTGISLNEYRTKTRLELARTLLHDPALTLDVVARRCGFEDARQLRRLWRASFGEPPSAFRRRPVRS